MATYDINNAGLAFLLALKLSGKAQHAYMAIDTKERDHHQKVK